MTREEAIAVLEESKRQNEIMRDNPSTFWASHQMAEGVKNAKRRIEAFEVALSAFRPVSRERVELYTNRLWPGCPRCSMTNDEAFDAGGAHEFRVLDDSLYYCDSNYGWEGEKIGYCPWCGKPLGKATELKHIEKLEVLLND